MLAVLLLPFVNVMAAIAFVDIDVFDMAPSERIALQIKELTPVRFRYPCITDEHGNSPRQNIQDAPCNLTMISATVFLVMLRVDV